MANERNTLTYRDAGVDIDAGNSLVDRIKPAAAATARPGVMGGLGGFGALFDLKAAGFRDPVLVAATDGVGTKLKIAIETGEYTHDRHRPRGHVRQRPRRAGRGAAASSSTISPPARSTWTPPAQVVEGIAEGCRRPARRWSAARRRKCRASTGKGDYDLAGFAVGAVERDALLPRADIAAGDVVLGLASYGVHSNGFSLVRRVVEMAGLRLGDPAPFDAGLSRSARRC